MHTCMLTCKHAHIVHIYAYMRNLWRTVVVPSLSMAPQQSRGDAVVTSSSFCVVTLSKVFISKCMVVVLQLSLLEAPTTLGGKD